METVSDSIIKAGSSRIVGEYSRAGVILLDMERFLPAVFLHYTLLPLNFRLAVFKKACAPSFMSELCKHLTFSSTVMTSNCLSSKVMLWTMLALAALTARGALLAIDLAVLRAFSRSSPD